MKVKNTSTIIYDTKRKLLLVSLTLETLEKVKEYYEEMKNFIEAKNTFSHCGNVSTNISKIRKIEFKESKIVDRESIDNEIEALIKYYQIRNNLNSKFLDDNRDRTVIDARGKSISMRTIPSDVSKEHKTIVENNIKRGEESITKLNNVKSKPENEKNTMIQEEKDKAMNLLNKHKAHLSHANLYVTNVEKSTQTLENLINKIIKQTLSVHPNQRLFIFSDCEEAKLNEIRFTNANNENCEITKTNPNNSITEYELSSPVIEEKLDDLGENIVEKNPDIIKNTQIKIHFAQILTDSMKNPGIIKI